MDRKGNGDIVELLFRQLIVSPASTPDQEKDIMVQLRNRTGSCKSGSGDRRSFERRSLGRRSSHTLSSASESSSSDSVHSVEDRSHLGLSNLVSNATILMNEKRLYQSQSKCRNLAKT